MLNLFSDIARSFEKYLLSDLQSYTHLLTREEGSETDWMRKVRGGCMAKSHENECDPPWPLWWRALYYNKTCNDLTVSSKVHL